MLKIAKGSSAAVGARDQASAPATRRRPPPPETQRAPGASISMLQTHSLPTLVQREIERLILEGGLAPGAKLNEAALADQLGVSRGPVREAFRALEESGLVRLEKNRGVYVRQIAVEEADEIYELRALLDAFVGRRVALVADAESLRELRALVARMERASSRNDVDAFLEANLAFHDRLVELAGNGKLLSTYRRLVNELRLFRRTSLAQGGALPTSAREHRQIVEHIAARDAEGAARALHDHVTASRARMHRSHAAAARVNDRKARNA